MEKGNGRQGQHFTQGQLAFDVALNRIEAALTSSCSAIYLHPPDCFL